jgi:hypothetical protein
VSEKYELIAAEKADPTSAYPVIKMCVWLGVSTSGFYDRLDAIQTARQRRRAKIIIHVKAAYAAGRGAYGVRRVHAVLARSDDPEVASCSEKLVRSVMAGAGPGRLPATRLQDHDPARPGAADSPAGFGAAGLHRRPARGETGR